MRRIESQLQARPSPSTLQWRYSETMWLQLSGDTLGFEVALVIPSSGSTLLLIVADPVILLLDDG